jgi:predicted AlkP superfamily pyrophosphatase or phosphodiesterase
MLTLYFEELDETSHRYGPESAESIAAIANVDRYIARLADGIKALDVSDELTIVIVSDHGQSAYRREKPALVLDEVVDLEGLDVVDGGSYAFLFAGDVSAERLLEIRDAINDTWPHGRAWLKGETPPDWHVATGSRFPELIVQADPGYGVIRSRDRDYIMTAGDHGWPPEFADMHGIFIAAGPRIPPDRLIEPLSVVDLYPMMREVLNLPPATVDGEPGVLLPLLAPASRTSQK